MVRPNQEAIDTFMSITDASESVAVQRLEEHGGDLNAAINAYFAEGDRTIAHVASTIAPADDFMDVDEPLQTESREPPIPLLSTGPNLNPFSILDQTFGPNLFDPDPVFSNRAPFVSHPRQRREIPIEVKDGDTSSAPSGVTPTIEDVTGTAEDVGPEVHGTVIIDDDDDDSNPSAPPAQVMNYDNDIEEEMIRAAIEASKREAQEGYSTQQFNTRDLSAGPESQPKPRPEDAELAQAVSLSLKTAEQEKAMREQLTVGPSEPLGRTSAEGEELQRIESPNGRIGTGTSSFHEETDEELPEEQPLVRNRNRNLSSVSLESADAVRDAAVSPASSPGDIEHNTADQSHLHGNGNAFPSDEWGGISSVEHDEAVMLEAAMFGGIPETSGYAAYAPHQLMHSALDGPLGSYVRPTARPPSPNLTAQRLLREQQDDEYFASLQADREKELRAKAEAEAAKEAARLEQKRMDELTQRKLEEEQELERQLTAKEASLPQEPTPDDENAVNLLVRMPDGSRRGRRFLKSNKLQFLFDFIDVGRAVKPGTYRLVRPYPRRAFDDGDSAVSLNDLGLTSKQEALFLELV